MISRSGSGSRRAIVIQIWIHNTVCVSEHVFLSSPGGDQSSLVQPSAMGASHFSESQKYVVYGMLERTASMARHYTSFHSSLVTSHGIDFQIYDLKGKMKIQTQAKSLCTMEYSLTFFCPDFSYTVTGSVDKSDPHVVRLPERLAERQYWHYKIVLYR